MHLPPCSSSSQQAAAEATIKSVKLYLPQTQMTGRLVNT